MKRADKARLKELTHRLAYYKESRIAAEYFKEKTSNETLAHMDRQMDLIKAEIVIIENISTKKRGS